MRRTPPQWKIACRWMLSGEHTERIGCGMDTPGQQQQPQPEDAYDQSHYSLRKHSFQQCTDQHRHHKQNQLSKQNSSWLKKNSMRASCRRHSHPGIWQWIMSLCTAKVLHVSEDCTDTRKRLGEIVHLKWRILAHPNRLELGQGKEIGCNWG